MVGTGRSRTAARQACTREMNAGAPAGSRRPAISSMSAPPMKAFSPSPVWMMAREFLVVAISLPNSSMNSPIMALFMGLSRLALQIGDSPYLAFREVAECDTDLTRVRACHLVVVHAASAHRGAFDDTAESGVGLSDPMSDAAGRSCSPETV